MAWCKRTVDTGLDDAARAISALEQQGISLRDVTDKLLTDGLASFQKSFDTLIAGLQKKTKALGKELVARVANSYVETFALLSNEDRLHARAGELVARRVAAA